MKYEIRELEAFSVIGQEIQLTGYRTKNIQISTQFWSTFNANLKKAYLSQSGTWLKYAFMERKNGGLTYFCAIPKRTIIPDGFILKEIQPHQYLVAEHTGAMNRIYDTYEELYRNLLPNIKYEPLPTDLIHFEKYDERFHWNRENSIIEIWIPIKERD